MVTLEFAQIVGRNSHAVEPEDPQVDLVSSVSVCSFEPSLVSTSLSFYHRVFAFLYFLIRSEKTHHAKFCDPPQ